MSFIYWLSKFSHEAMLVEGLLIGTVAAAYFGYLLIQKRRYGVAKKNIPDHVVRAFLIELISYSEGFKNQLFGENFKIPAGMGLTRQAEPTLAAAAAPAATGDPAELSALRTALATTSAKAEELAKIVAQLTADKGALEKRLVTASAAAPAAAAGAGDDRALAEARDKIGKLESKLAEYEVIEDDLANLKKYQQENKSLKSQLEAYQKGGAPSPVAAAAPEAPAPVAAAPMAAAPSPVAAAEETAAASQAADSFEGLVDKVEESLAPPVGASATDPFAAAAAQMAPPASDIAAAAPPPPPAAAAAAPEAPAAAPPKEKSDADLLNEFERMLSS